MSVLCVDPMSTPVPYVNPSDCVLQGLGLYAARDLEKHTMVIEYIGDLIRNETANRREKEYDDQVCLHSCQSPSAPVLWVSFCWLLALKLATT